MYGDQSGEIGCRYWGLEGQGWEAQYNEYYCHSIKWRC